jgi:hypothetical protein
MRTHLLLAATFSLLAPLFAQAQWTQVATGGPPPRNSTALVFDAARGVAVMYGGFGGSVLADTWEWNGTGWTLRLQNSPPGILNGHAMAYDASRGVTVLFGGARNNAFGVGETWEWDGATWTQRATTGPQGRVNHQLCYDAARRVVVLYGGHVNYNAGPDLGDTWEWNGASWVQRATTGPGLRTYHAMAYDVARQRTVLFGGRSGSALNDTWEWDGVSWSQRSPATSPPARFDHEMAYDEVRRRIVIFSGFTQPADTWEYDGANWTQRTIASTSPGGRYAYGFCFDPARRRTLLFGGYQGGQRADTWTYHDVVTAQYSLSGSGCPGQNGVPSLSNVGGALPWLGETFTLQVGNLSTTGLAAGILGASDTTFGSLPLPLDLAFLGMPGCRLYVSLDVVVPLTNNGGLATWSLPLPSIPHLTGARFHQQVANASPGSNALGLTTSNYGTATLGSR